MTYENMRLNTIDLKSFRNIECFGKDRKKSRERKRENEGGEERKNKWGGGERRERKQKEVKMEK